MASTRREEEYARQYKLTGDKHYLDLSLKEMEDLVYSTVRSMNLSQGIDTRVLFYKGMGYAKDAIETWDPSKSKLSTHVVNTMQPIHRDVYKYGPTLHTPEHSIKDFGNFKKVYDEYTNEFGELDPDPVVLSDMSGLSRKKVEEFLQRERKTYNTSTQTFRPVEYIHGDHRLDLDYLGEEFKTDPLKKKIWKYIKKTLSDPNALAPNARDVYREIQGSVSSYYEVNKAYNEIVDTINAYLRSGK